VVVNWYYAMSGVFQEAVKCIAPYGARIFELSGCKNQLLILIIRMNIHKANHRCVNRLRMAALGLSMSQYETILYESCMVFVVANLN